MNAAPLAAVAPAAGSSFSAERLSRLPAAEQRRAVAEQFEAILLRQLLGPALKVLPGAGNEVYGYMLTDALAQKLSAGRGLGFAQLLERQFTPPGAARSPESAAGSAPTGGPPALKP